MPLPIVQGSEVSTPSSGTPLDSGAFRNAALAPGRLGAAIGQDVGGLFDDISQQAVQAHNAGITYKADTAMRMTKETFTGDLAKMPDPQTWLPAYQERTAQTREQIMSQPGIGPALKRQLTNKLDVWQAATTGEIRTAALIKQSNQDREAGIAGATFAATQGDEEGANAFYDSMVDHKLMSPQDAERHKLTIPGIAAQAKSDILISTDPIHAPELIKQFEGKIAPRNFVSLQEHAREAQSKARSTNGDQWLQRLDASPDGTIDLEGLKKDVEAGNVTEVRANGIKMRMAKLGMDKAKEDFSFGMANAQDHDWTQDKNPEATAEKMKDELSQLPTALRTRAYTYIDRQKANAVKEGEKMERPVEKQIFDQMQEDRTHNGMSVPLTNERVKGDWHMFGPNDPDSVKHNPITGGLNAIRNPYLLSDKQITDFYGKDVKRADIIHAEQAHYADMQGKMRAWFTDPANKDATYDEANDYRMKLEQPFITSKIMAASSAKRRLVKQGGKTYDFETGEEVK